MAIIAKRTVMHLYSDKQDPYSHQVRMVLAEKGVNVEIQQISEDEKPEGLLEINPYGTAPTLLDRELILYEARIIMEYLDERFPHPPLLPVYPVARAEHRKMMYRIERDWYSMMHKVTQGTDKQAEAARQQLSDSLLSLGPVFADKPFFLSTEFSLIDCCLAPLLWRLPQLGITLPNTKPGKAIQAYMGRIFKRTAFQASLTDEEREIEAA